jgi:cyanophycin synthetase
MAAATDAEVIYFSRSAHNHIVTAHLANGGRAVVGDQQAIILATGESRITLVELERLEWTLGGRIGFQVLNALAATAAAWACGANPALIARALATFGRNEAMVPGRFNRQEINQVEVIVDYGHNAPAMAALASAIQALDSRRTLMVLGLPGDRRDEDIQATVQQTLEVVDEYILHDLHDRRGREIATVPQLMHQQIGVQPTTIVANAAEAIKLAWSKVQPGDRLVIIADQVDEALELVGSLTAVVPAEVPCTVPLAREYGASYQTSVGG